MELIYRESRDGTTANVFHNKCNNGGPKIIYIYGGYYPISWNSNGGWQFVPEYCIFILTNIYNIELTKFNRVNEQCGIYFGFNFEQFF